MRAGLNRSACAGTTSKRSSWLGYSPDFNPIERLWQHLKSLHLAAYLTKRGKELSGKLFGSIRELIAKPEILRSVCATHSPEANELLRNGVSFAGI